MVFNSINFLIFFPTILILYFLTPKKYRWATLLLASYYFYMSCEPTLIFLIIFTTCTSYVTGIAIENTNMKKKKKIYLGIALFASLGTLIFFKYFNFIANSAFEIAKIFGGKETYSPLNILLPVGISFYTFQTLSYVIDIYRGNIKAETHLGYYALYVSFFPQLVAGPIERPENLIPQLHLSKNPDEVDIISGVWMMLVGFFKKIVIADMLANYVNAIYNAPEVANGLAVLIATVLFAFQIYCDFSGYTDIAIGCARIMGIRLMQNFDRPYKSESIKEFWGRWHISLSSWFKDYLYIPLGGSKCKKSRHMLNIFIVFMISGLWHGSAWTFVIWGTIHSIYQIIENLTKLPREKLLSNLGISKNNKFIHFTRRIITFLLVCFAWIFFRANSFADIQLLINSLFTNWNINLTYINTTFNLMRLTYPKIIIVILSLFILAKLDKITSSISKLGINIKSLPINLSNCISIVTVITISSLYLLDSGITSAFIYFQF